jgi:hypothetical protein
MIMLDAGRVLREGPRGDFEALRAADPAELTAEGDRLIHQFLNGASSGPLTDADGTSEYEKLLVRG